MNRYEVIVERRVAKQIAHLPRQEQERCFNILQYLENDPFPPASLKMSNSPYYRIRFGDYRIIYDVSENEVKIYVLKVGHRKESYR